MNKLLVILVFLLFSYQQVIASEDGSGTYIGLAGGYTTYNASFLFDRYYINEGVNASTTRSFNADASGLKVYGGYQFNKIVAVEAAYIEYGNFNTTNYSQDPSSFSVYANLGYNFLNGQLRPFGIVGLGYLNTFQSRDLLRDSFATFHAGLGIEYSPTVLKGLGFRASLDWDHRFDYEEAVDENNNLQDSVLFFQRYSLWSVAIQYKF